MADKPDFGQEFIQGPLSVPLVAAYLFNKGSGDFAVDIVGGGGNATTVTPPMANTWTSGVSAPHITSLSFTGSSNDALRLASTVIVDNSAPYAVVMGMTPVAVTGAALISISDNASSNFQDMVRLQDSKIHVGTRRGGAFSNAVSSTTITTGVTYTVGANFTSDSSRSVYINGVSEDTNTDSFGVITYTNIDIGRLGDLTPNTPFDGDLLFCYIFDRALTTPEMLSIHNDPYQMVASPSNTLPATFGITQSVPTVLSGISVDVDGAGACSVLFTTDKATTLTATAGTSTVEVSNP